jgi:hypothetical protein
MKLKELTHKEFRIYFGIQHVPIYAYNQIMNVIFDRSYDGVIPLLFKDSQIIIVRTLMAWMNRE